jgi:ABC-type transporter Mla MlaB component
MASDQNEQDAVAQPELWESELVNLIAQAEAMLREARRVPLTGLVLADAEGLAALLDHMRQVLPEDVRRARWIVAEHARLLAEAEDEARRRVESADARLETLVNEATVTRAAEERAAAILARAEETARDTRQAARRYVADLLARVQAQTEEVARRLEANRRELDE